MGSGPICVPLHGELVIPMGILLVCDDLLGIRVAHEDREFGLVEYLADTCDEKNISIVWPSTCDSERGQTLICLYPCRRVVVIAFPIVGLNSIEDASGSAFRVHAHVDFREHIASSHR